jgi:hypothetical protein
MRDLIESGFRVVKDATAAAILPGLKMKQL